MRRLAVFLSTVGILLFQLPVYASNPPVGEIRNFGPNLKDICPNPEGIALDPEGNLYAASFAFQPVANICVEDSSGQIVDVIHVPAWPKSEGGAGIVSLLGELFEPGHGLYVVDFADGAPGHGRLLKVDPASHGVTTLAIGYSAANAIAEDEHRNLFVSDSFSGRIYKVTPGGSNTVWTESVLLQPHGTPPFGANGVAFDREQKFLYVTNTADWKILRVPVEEDGSAGRIETFADGHIIDAAQGTKGALHGADGIMFDVKGNLYVCANQEDEIQILSPEGKLAARYHGDGSNRLDFPASLVFKGKTLFITNLSLASGVNSKLSVMRTRFPGLPVTPQAGEEEDS
jgi:sugar lactone lactonase YvrE